MALIGPNGAGKTTILRMIHGDLKPDQGEITKPKFTKIGYLPQEEVVIDKGSLLEVVLESQENIVTLERQIKSLQHDLEKNHDPSFLEKLGRLEHEYQALGGYDLEHQAKKILSGLGFKDSDFDRPIKEFSGGWRMRSYLASLLLQNPDVLLMDEPTNHLDIPSLEWLEAYLQKFSGSVIIVSHDRFFIDRLVTEIYELDRGKLTHYSGNYHQYEKQKEERLELLKKQWKSQQDYLKQQQQFIDRFRYKATKAAQVQSRIKQVEKVDMITLPSERQTWSFTLKVDKPSYKDVLQMKSMSFKYDREWIFEDVSFNLYRGDHLALVGPNGIGKTTFTKLIHQDLVPQEGSVKVGTNVETGYYSQHQIDALDMEKTVWEEVESSTAISATQQIRDMLGIFQFSGDDVHKRISVLSGGEKARVSLTKILLSPANFLIMDEPTNHLDMISKEALEHALQSYSGTLLLISHDRYFLTKLVRRVIEIRNHRLRVYEGNYSDYLRKRQQEEALQVKSEKDTDQNTQGRKSREQKRIEAEQRNALNQKKRPAEKNVKQCEETIAELEDQQEALEKELADPKTYENSQHMMKLQTDYAENKSKLDSLYPKWEKAQAELESIIQEFET